MAPPEHFAVSVVLAEPGRQAVVDLQVEPGTTAAVAVARSGLLDARTECGQAGLGLAIFGRAIGGDQALEPGDRVEILRPLRKDPRARRRQLAREGRTMGRKSPGAG